MPSGCLNMVYFVLYLENHLDQLILRPSARVTQVLFLVFLQTLHRDIVIIVTRRTFYWY